MHSNSGTWPLVPPQRGPLFSFLPHVFLAVTVTRGAEKHFALLFGAGNSYTVYIRPSKIPENPRIFFAPLLGSLYLGCGIRPKMNVSGRIFGCFGNTKSPELAAVTTLKSLLKPTKWRPFC